MYFLNCICYVIDLSPIYKISLEHLQCKFLHIVLKYNTNFFIWVSHKYVRITMTHCNFQKLHFVSSAKLRRINMILTYPPWYKTYSIKCEYNKFQISTQKKNLKLDKIRVKQHIIKPPFFNINFFNDKYY